jgi:serine/threonine protein kinase
LLWSNSGSIAASSSGTAKFFEDGDSLKGPLAKSRLPDSVRLEDALSTNDPCLIDFVKRCLTWDQSERMMAAECLQHPFITAHEIEASTHPPLNQLFPFGLFQRSIVIGRPFTTPTSLKKEVI